MFRWCIIFLIPWTQISLAEEFNDPQLSYFGIQCSDGYEKVSQVINLEEQIEIDAPLFLHEKASISFCRSEMNQLKQGPFLISDKNGMKATGEFENDIVKAKCTFIGLMAV